MLIFRGEFRAALRGRSEQPTTLPTAAGAPTDG
jgi:hypothetical protein